MNLHRGTDFLLTRVQASGYPPASSSSPSRRGGTSMSEHGKPPNAPRLSPYLVVRNAEASLDFYARAFGCGKGDTVPGEDGRIAHAEMRFHESLIMFAPEGVFGNTSKAPATSGAEPPIGLYLYCDDVDALCARAKAAGATVFKEPA